MWPGSPYRKKIREMRRPIRSCRLIRKAGGIAALVGLLVTTAACADPQVETPPSGVTRPPATVTTEAAVAESPSPPPTPRAAATPSADEAAPAPSPSPTATPAGSAPLEYEVEPNDTLSEIARRFGLTTSELAEANEIENPDDIRAGEVLRIPTAPAGSDRTPSPSPTPTVQAESGGAQQSPAPAVLTGIAVEKVGDDFEEPVQLTHAGDGSGRLFIVGRRGTIQIIQGGAVQPAPFLNIGNLVSTGGSEQGLLGLAFHPGYRNNGRLFVNYTDTDGHTVIAEYRVSADDPNRANPDAVKVVLEYEQPYRNHNGGMLAFGADGYLYVGTGDGGSGGDPLGNGQKLTTVLGKMLRIDVDAGSPYAVPSDNPFVGVADVRPEIWAYGLRNPWRYSFDRETGDLYIADVGQNSIEEVSFQPAGSAGGENYGWNITEGSRCFSPGEACDKSGFVLPIAEYSHEEGCSITGGYVYRGQSETALRGHYVFGDYCSGRIWTSVRSADGAWTTTERLTTGLSISSFGEDENGEIYFLDYRGGAIFRIKAVTG